MFIVKFYNIYFEQSVFIKKIMLTSQRLMLKNL